MGGVLVGSGGVLVAVGGMEVAVAVGGATAAVWVRLSEKICAAWVSTAAELASSLGPQAARKKAARSRGSKASARFLFKI